LARPGPFWTCRQARVWAMVTTASSQRCPTQPARSTALNPQSTRSGTQMCSAIGVVCGQVADVVEGLGVSKYCFSLALHALAGAPGGSRTPGPRLRRLNEVCPRSSKASQPLATTRDEARPDSRQSQIFAPVTENSADRLRTLLTVREVAAYLRVSTATVYELCARGELQHIRCSMRSGCRVGL